MSRATAPPERGELRLALAVALGGLTVVLDTTIAVLALPVLIRVFDAPLATVQWVTTAYLLALVTSMPLSAWLGERFGRRRVYVVALLVFAVASAWAGETHSIGELIAARVVQGLGGGLINPLGTTIALSAVPAVRRGRTAALLGLPVLVGPVVGPVLAGWLIDTVSWRAIFLVTVPPAVVSAVLVRRLAPPDRPDADSGTAPTLDVVGVLFLVPGVVGVVFGVGQASAPTAVRLAAVLIGATLTAIFVRRALRIRAPLLDVRLLRDPGFCTPLVVLVLFAAAYFGAMLLTPTYVQITRGGSAVVAGSLGIPAGLATGLTLQVATRLVDRVPARRIMTVGLSLSVVSSAVGIAVLRPDLPFSVLGVLGAAAGVGAGAVIMPGMTAATRRLSGARLSAGSAVLTLCQQLSAAVGTAGVSALFAAAVAWRAPGLPGGLAGVPQLPAARRAQAAPDLVDAQRLTQLAILGVIVAALVLARRVRDSAAAPPGHDPGRHEPVTGATAVETERSARA